MFKCLSHLLGLPPICTPTWNGCRALRPPAACSRTPALKDLLPPFTYHPVRSTAYTRLRSSHFVPTISSSGLTSTIILCSVPLAAQQFYLYCTTVSALHEGSYSSTIVHVRQQSCLTSCLSVRALSVLLEYGALLGLAHWLLPKEDSFSFYRGIIKSGAKNATQKSSILDKNHGAEQQRASAALSEVSMQ